MANNKAQPIIIVKKRGAGGHKHHGGAWKVAYADFVTAMMAFFLVMWVIGADETTKAAIEGYFNNTSSNSPISMLFSAPKGGEQLRQFDERSPAGGRPIDMPAGRVNTETTNDGVLIETKELLEESISLELGVSSSSKRIEMTYDSQGLVLRIAAKDFFSQGSSELKEDFLPVIYKIGKILVNTDRLIRVEGHADLSERISGENGEAWDLSTRRAGAVARYWKKMIPGFDPKRLQIAGNSYHRPLNESKTSEDRAENRRVEIILLNTQFEETK